MHNNLTHYNKRISRIQKLKRKRRRMVSIIVLLSLLLFLSSFVIYKFYKKIKCRDLQYAVEYQLTSGTPSERLMRVQHITLLFNDNTSAVVEVSGLSKDEPHYQTTIKGTFKKGSFNSWKLINSEKS